MKNVLISALILVLGSFVHPSAHVATVTDDDQNVAPANGLPNYLYTSDEIIDAVKSKNKGLGKVIPYFGDYQKADIRQGLNRNGLWYLSNYFVSDPGSGMTVKVVIMDINGKKYTFNNTEAAYQAGKSLIAGTISKEKEIMEFVHATPNYSKYLANTKYNYRHPGRQDLIDDLMENIVYQKFANGPLGKMLLADTGKTTLIEGNDWGDSTWGQPFDGVKHSPGKSKLGKIIMKVREDLRTMKIKVNPWQIH